MQMRNVTTANKARRAGGFTMVELMIVVGIIGILAAIALPAYAKYQTKSQVSEALQALGAAKVGVGEFFADTGNWCDTTSKCGLAADTSGRYLSDITLAPGGAGTLVATLGGDINAAVAGKKIAIQPMKTPGGTIIFYCGFKRPGGASTATATAAQNSSVDASTVTDVSNDFLPATCRA
jgi:type IV pilus assembly protein PilA